MKSIQVANTMRESEQKDFSELQVLKSGAGWYIGTIFTDPKTGFQEPGSRDTGYYASEEDAKLALRVLVSLTARQKMLARPAVDIWQEIMFMIGLDPSGGGYRETP